VGLLRFADHDGTLDQAAIGAACFVCDSSQFETLLEKLCGIFGRCQCRFRGFVNVSRICAWRSFFKGSPGEGPGFLS
jgi:hypothetical protein